MNTDKIIQVSFETYNFLENNIWDEKAEREIEKLINEGYLKRTRVEEVKHFATDFLESYLENRMNQLVLQVTQNVICVAVIVFILVITKIEIIVKKK